VYVVEFTLHAKPGHYGEVADLYSVFAAEFLSTHEALENVLVVGDEAGGLVRGIGVYAERAAADAVNSDPQFAAFNDAIASLLAQPPERVELTLLHSFARG
jgi:quinol monooxygenase YgiN